MTNFKYLQGLHEFRKGMCIWVIGVGVLEFKWNFVGTSLLQLM
jgi:hypothetical protein